MRSQLMVCAAGFVGVLAAAAMAAAPEIDVVGYRVKVQNERIVLIGEERDRGIAFVYPPNARKPIRLEGVSTQKRGIADVQVLANGYLFTNEGSDVSNVLGVLRTPDGKEVWRCPFGRTEYTEGYLEMAPSGEFAVSTGSTEFLLLDGATGRKLVEQSDVVPYAAAFVPSGDILVVSGGCVRLFATKGIRDRAKVGPIPLDSLSSRVAPLADSGGQLLGPVSEVVTDWFYGSPRGGLFCAKLLPLRSNRSRHEPCRVVLIDTALNIWTTTLDSAVFAQVRNVNVVSDRYVLLTANCRALVLDAVARSVVGRYDEGLSCIVWQAMEQGGTISFVRLDDMVADRQRKEGILKTWQEAEWAVPLVFDTRAKTFRTTDTLFVGRVEGSAVVRRRESRTLSLRKEP